MIIIPAIDIKNGRCVRLRQGRKDEETVFSDDPAKMAMRFDEDGAELIHVIDLDGAFKKSPQNLNSIKKIIESVKTCVQVGGGIRDKKTIRMFIDLGAKKVVIGTEAIKNPELVKDSCKEFPDQVVVGVDARNGMVAIEGWTETTKVEALDLAKQFEDCGVAAINFTDIHRDGMQTGPNIKETMIIAQNISIPVVASGGVSTIEDIKNLIELNKFGVTGIITGRALYSGKLNLKEAIKLTKNISYYR